MEYFSNGKLLISGEYLVLQGALALATPVRFGQSLNIEYGSGLPMIRWQSFINNIPWFTTDYAVPDLKIIACSDQHTARYLQKLLTAANEMNPEALRQDIRYEVTAHIGFDIQWGLGSSSSLISNLAWWFDVDPFELLKKVNPGSGYDIACARSDKALFYRLVRENPIIEHIQFRPKFKDSLFFVYLGQKQDSLKSVLQFNNDGLQDQMEIDYISTISRLMAITESYAEFSNCMDEPEKLLARILNRKTIKAERFADFPSSIKSLGAWGGDFIIVTWNDSRSELEKYFHAKGLTTIFSFDEIIL